MPLDSEPCDECGVDTLKLLAERDAIQSKLTEMESVLAWASENVWGCRRNYAHSKFWVVADKTKCSDFREPTLYEALKSAWEAREK